MSIPYHDESLLWTERHRQAVIDQRPCPSCGGDRLRADFTDPSRCHVPRKPQSTELPPSLADPDPATPDPVQFTIRTRYGVETHYANDEHRTGPTCPCGPDIDWRTT